MLAELDSRNRISLARVATARQYVVTVEPSGRIILDPAVVLTAAEAAALSHDGLHQQVVSSLRAGTATQSRPARSSR